MSRPFISVRSQHMREKGSGKTIRSISHKRGIQDYIKKDEEGGGEEEEDGGGGRGKNGECVGEIL